MSEFYRINTASLDDSQYAFCDTAAGAQYGSKDSAPKCPQCGAPIGSRYWLEPRRVVLSKPKYGDFVYGLWFLVSENFKTAYEKSALKGIEEFLPVEVAKIRYVRPFSPKPPQYYKINLEYSFARIDLEKTRFSGQPEERYCSLCKPFGMLMDVVNGVYIDDAKWGGEDIFHLHETGGAAYASQRFVDFCLAHGFTNLQVVNTKEFVRPIAYT